MRYFLAIFFILFLMIAIFGFVGMAHADHGNGMEGGCIASILDNSICASDALPMVMHHISAFQSFSSVVVGNLADLTPLLLSVLVFSLFLFWRRLSGSIFQHLSVIFFNRLKFQFAGRYHALPVLSWLSLFENSPSFK